jgi:uncharacterized repeat protein (TIGR01451 family)
VLASVTAKHVANEIIPLIYARDGAVYSSWRGHVTGERVTMSTIRVSLACGVVLLSLASRPASSDTIIPRDPDSVLVCPTEDACLTHEEAQSRLCDANTGTASQNTAEVILDTRRIEARETGDAILEPNKSFAEIATRFRTVVSFPATINVGAQYSGHLRGSGNLDTQRGTVRIRISLFESDPGSPGTLIGDPQVILDRTENGNLGPPQIVNALISSASDAVDGTLQAASFTHDLDVGKDYEIVVRLDVEAVGLNSLADFRTGSHGVTVDCLTITPNMEDADGDGLFDDWETSGLDMGEDGFLDLASLGANPQRKDVFLELDWLASDKPTRVAIKAMKDAFNLAPVSNPGASGIKLWVDTGSLADGSGLVGDNLGGGNRITTTDILGQAFNLSSLTENFYTVKKQNFDPRRRLVFRYGMSYASPNNDTGTSTGNNTATTLNDTNQNWLTDEWKNRTVTITGGTNVGDACAIVSNTNNQLTISGCGGLPNWTTTPDTTSTYRISGTGGQAFGASFIEYVHDPATVMHELGHTLGLGHGGADDGRNCKPNYLSVMNYRYQPGGIPVLPGADSGIDWDVDSVFETIDFSPPRFKGGRAVAPLAPLDESMLNEGTPLDPTDSAHQLIFVNGANQYASAPIGSAIDWNGDGDSNDGIVTVNTNIAGPNGEESACNRTPNTQIETAAAGTAITGNHDWSNLRYNFRLDAEFQSKPDPGELEPHPTLEDYERRKKSLRTTDLGLTKAFEPSFTAAGQDVTLRLTVSNAGPNIAHDVVVTDSLSEELSVVDMPQDCNLDASHTLRCELGAIQSGKTAQREVRLHIAADIDCDTAQIRNFANTASVENRAGPDLNIGNNEASTELRALCARYDYAAKFVCGSQASPTDMRLARGWYATTVNVHNPNDEVVTVFSKLALSHPSQGNKGGETKPFRFSELGYDQVVGLECDEVRRSVFSGEFPTPYIEGFLVVQSPRSLDVTGLYSSANLDGHDTAFGQASVHTEQIRERQRKKPPEYQSSAKPDLLPTDPRCLPPNPGTGNIPRAVEVTVRNAGSDRAGKSDLRASFSAGTSAIKEIAELSAGQSQTLEIKLPEQCAPACRVTFYADSGNTVAESNEGNNQSVLECLPLPG